MADTARYGGRQWWYLLAAAIDDVGGTFISGSLYERACKRICEAAADACRLVARHSRRR